jgi:hypothetical protein
MTPTKFTITISDAGYGFDVHGGEGTDRTVIAVKIYEALYYVLRSPEELAQYVGADYGRMADALHKRIIREKGDVIVPPVDGLN